MLGERGLWFKMSFFDGSSRVPMMISAPERFAPRNIDQPASTLDLLPTLMDLAHINIGTLDQDLDGVSLLDALNGGMRPDPVVRVEYAAEGSIAPMVMVREGDYKFIATLPDPVQLFDLARDPDELKNLADDPALSQVRAALEHHAFKRWDLKHYDQDVRRSQQRRLAVYDALRNGHYYPWDFQPLQKASERYMRNHMDLNVVESDARFPRKAP
jgi:choline-sulfatase